MKTSRLKIHVMALAIALVTVGILVGSYIAIIRWIKDSLIRPYNVFRIQEMDTIPQFDRLNESIADSLPPMPANVQLEMKGSGGINGPQYLHGRYLYLHLIKPTSVVMDVYTYYQEYFESAGWLEIERGYTTPYVVYNRNTGCVEIMNFGPDIKNDYETIYITIWHDFKHQAFSPEIPEMPGVLFDLFEVGKTSFAECP